MPEKLDRMVKNIAASYRKKHPNWSEKRIMSIAWATAQKLYRKVHCYLKGW